MRRRSIKTWQMTNRSFYCSLTTSHDPAESRCPKKILESVPSRPVRERLSLIHIQMCIRDSSNRLRSLVSATIGNRHLFLVSAAVPNRHPFHVSARVSNRHLFLVSAAVSNRHPFHFSPAVSNRHPFHVSAAVSNRHPFHGSATVSNRCLLYTSRCV